MKTSDKIAMVFWMCVTAYLVVHVWVLEDKVNALEHATVTIPNVIQQRKGYPTYGNSQGAGDVEIFYQVATNITVQLNLKTNLNKSQ